MEYSKLKDAVPSGAPASAGKVPGSASRLRPRREIVLTVGGILFTFFATAMVAWELGASWWARASAGEWGGLAAHSLFMVIVAFLIYGGLVYQFTRLAYYRRRASHRPAPWSELETFYDGTAPSLTVLVPSYREEESVIAQTLLSAALQEYPKRRVVLLIDDPPSPSNAEDRAGLAAARLLPARIRQLLQAPCARFSGALAAFDQRTAAPVDLSGEQARLADLYEEAVAWFDERIGEQSRADHVDALFIDKVLAVHRDRLQERAAAIRGGEGLDVPALRRQYRRLVSLFDVELTSFERKRYVNLSHEPNKAMNLNSYIGLVGKAFRERRAADGLYLEALDGAGQAAADLVVPDTDYFITLDADSILVPEYALRLIHLMEQPDNARIAVAQTPYSAIPGAPGALERIAGATTDIQYIIHQGFTAYGATYWVGANALLRRTALEEIAVTEEERGFPVTRYIQDRTVIEDTESSVDLVDRDWQLYNYPERMAYSATPPDFGSLLIQRRRWANGGLIILPKLLRYLARGGAQRGEAFMRIHYLVSIAAVNIGLLVLLAVPFHGSIESLWLPLTAAAYFSLYARDLKLIGYRVSDLFRVYALNLLLIPVNLGGVVKSLQQAWTREKIPFGRTPKVAGRTGAAPLYVVAVYALLGSWLVGSAVDLADGHWAHAIFAAVNAGFLLYAVVTFVGLRASREDLAPCFRMPTFARVLRGRRATALPEAAAADGIAPEPLGRLADEQEDAREASESLAGEPDAEVAMAGSRG